MGQGGHFDQSCLSTGDGFGEVFSAETQLVNDFHSSEGLQFTWLMSAESTLGLFGCKY